MTLDEYIDYRKSIFYPKTDDEEVNILRHDVIVFDNKIRRYSTLSFPNFGVYAEDKVISEVRKYKIPAIPTLIKKDSDGELYQVMRRARGKSLYEITDHDIKNRYYVNLAKILIKLHNIPVGSKFGFINPTGKYLIGLHDKWNEYLLTKYEDHVKYLIDNNLVDDEFITKKMKLVYFYPNDFINFRPSLLHGDLNDHNIFFKDYEISDIIDWEDALIGDPIYELAHWATFHNYEDHKFLIDSYFEFQKKPDRYYQIFWSYYLRVSISKLVQLHRYGFEDLRRAKERINLATMNL